MRTSDVVTDAVRHATNNEYCLEVLVFSGFDGLIANDKATLEERREKKIRENRRL